MPALSLVLFAAVLAVAAGSPGPSVLALVARVLARGPASVLPFLAAMWIGEGVWLSCTVFGLTYLAHAFAWCFAALRYAGAAYLLFLAWRLWHAPAQPEAGALPAPDRPLRLFLSGLAITLGNPKIMVFYLALLPSIIDMARISLIGWGELVATMAVVLIAVDLSWVAFAAYARRWLRRPGAVRIAHRASATALGGAALAIAAT